MFTVTEMGAEEREDGVFYDVERSRHATRRAAIAAAKELARASDEATLVVHHGPKIVDIDAYVYTDDTGFLVTEEER